MILSFSIPPAKADEIWTETIYIRADGSVDPDTAPLLSTDNITYTLTSNIVADIPEDSSAIVVERDGIVFDGAGYTVQGTAPVASTGMDLYHRSNVTIRNTKIRKFSLGIGLSKSSDNIIFNNTVTENEWFGIALFGSSNNNTITGNNITANNSYGISSRGSYNTITDNNITANNYYGIYLVSSSNNTISGNELRNNTYGIQLSGASNNSICRNQITANKADGIWSEASCDNIIEENSIEENDYNGIELESQSSNNSISRNHISNNHNVGIELGEDSSNNHVDGNTVTGNEYGIFLGLCSDNKISGNELATNQQYGIGFSHCSNNTVSENMITNNSYGIQVFRAHNNKFYHNHFINNTQQVFILTSDCANSWDDGYPSGGNYWTNYNGTDSDSDGIGDIPYNIDTDNTDNYPLMGMFSDFNATSEHHVQTICNSTISAFRFDGTAISFNVTGEDGTLGFCRICIPTALLNDTYRVFVNGTEVSHTVLAFSNSTHCYLYFTYTHSTQDVVIIPEFLSYLTLPLFIISTLLAAILYRRKCST